MKLPKDKRLSIEFRDKTYKIKYSSDVNDIFGDSLLSEEELPILRLTIRPFLETRYSGKDLETGKYLFEEKYDDFISIMNNYNVLFPYQSKKDRWLKTSKQIFNLLLLGAVTYGTASLLWNYSTENDSPEKLEKRIHNLMHIPEQETARPFNIYQNTSNTNSPKSL